MEINREHKILIGSILGLVLIVGAILSPRKPQVSIPTADEVDSIQLIFHSKNLKSSPILSDSSEGKADIAQLVQWIGSAKSMGYEKSGSAKISKGPTELIIKLDNHNEMGITEVWLPDTVTEPSGKVLRVLKRSDKYVDIRSSDTTGPNGNDYDTSGVAYRLIRYYSPELATWINSGWRNDWNQ